MVQMHRHINFNERISWRGLSFNRVYSKPGYKYNPSLGFK